MTMGPESLPWSPDSYPIHVGLFLTLSLLILILLLVSCGNCMRKTVQFSTESNYVDSKRDSQLLSITQFEDPKHPNSVSNAAKQEGAPGSRKVSWQNDMHVAGTQDDGDGPSQHSRALPQIPNAPVRKEHSNAMGDPVYQTAKELAAATDTQLGEDPIEPPYAASNQFSLQTPTVELIIEDDVGKGEAGAQSEKMPPVYARISKKPKDISPRDLPLPPSALEEVQYEQEPPPIPEKCFPDDDDDVVLSESSDTKTDGMSM
ncbi:uncharacterized protein LOC119976782 [Scyliorhinus canicula]|uniref:uncharacterized protein LOC119976782 n=1 Tax=Scyliorhinus canicula TaxID=7830 RepID=UPI0018F3CA3C|nr:uncharacterized protein LOC119976782 [Scyliorhinus canicula]